MNVVVCVCVHDEQVDTWYRVYECVSVGFLAFQVVERLEQHKKYFGTS